MRLLNKKMLQTTLIKFLQQYNTDDLKKGFRLIKKAYAEVDQYDNKTNTNYLLVPSESVENE